MDVIISNKIKKENNYILSSTTLDNKYIYIDTSNNKKKEKLNNFLVYGICKYENNKDFNINKNIEILYSGIYEQKEYLNISEIFLDERELYIKEQLYLVMLIKSTIKNKDEIKIVLENKIFTSVNNDSIEVNELIDINDNRIKVYDVNIPNIIQINNVIYDIF